MNLETTTIIRKPKTITITDIYEDEKVSVKAELVDEIAEKSFEDEDMISILLATIEASRKHGSTEKNKIKKIPQSCLIENIPILLERFTIEHLCEEMEHMKYHHIREIMESADPIETLHEYI